MRRHEPPPACVAPADLLREVAAEMRAEADRCEHDYYQDFITDDLRRWADTLDAVRVAAAALEAKVKSPPADA